MLFSSLIALAAGLLGAAPAVSGVVVDAAGAPIAGAQVFAEAGLMAPLLETRSDSEGRFAFEALDTQGPVGIFAIAQGHAWGGQHVTLAPGAEMDALRLVLLPPGTFEAKVENAKGKAVEGARVTRLGLLYPSKVGIPLAKLTQHGFNEPQSDSKGRVSIPNLPQGGRVALKVGHPEYAQEGVEGLEVGARGNELTLHRGVLVEGVVMSQSERAPVPRAAITIRNAQPPHETAVARGNSQGKFALRLKPGVYLARAETAGLASPAWAKLVVTGERGHVRPTVYVVETGRIRGTVRNAVTEAPVEGARLSLQVSGSPAAVTRTGPDGVFSFEAGAGENVVQLLNAPGYQPPQSPVWQVQVQPGEQVELPGLWLKPMPPFRLQVLDQQGAPAPGALVRLLRPHQIGWQVADAQGNVTLEVVNISPDGKVVGMAEAADKNHGALFSLEPADAAGARVQLMPLGSVRGTVENEKGRAVEGAVVGAVFPGDSTTDATLLWRTITDGSGAYSWPAVAPGVPQQPAARAVNGVSAAGDMFNLAPSDSRALNAIVLADAAEGESLLGKKLDWQDWPVLCGQLPPKETLKRAHKLIIFTGAAETEAIAGVLATAAKTLGPNLIPVAAAGGGVDCEDAGMLVVQGQAPGRATTYVLDQNNRVVMELLGAPPLAPLRGMIAGGGGS